MKRKIPILLMMTLLLTGCAVPKPATEANTYRQITMDEAVTMMAQETGYITEEELPLLNEWRKDPAHWNQ